MINRIVVLMMLSVVTFGCSLNSTKSIEKCADNNFIKVNQWIFNETQKMVLKMDVYEFIYYCEKELLNLNCGPNSIVRDMYFGTHNMARHKKVFFQKPLNEKLHTDSYAVMFKDCEVEKKKYPITFYEQWN